MVFEAILSELFPQNWLFMIFLGLIGREISAFLLELFEQ
jgi:hypothetical protein